MNGHMYIHRSVNKLSESRHKGIRKKNAGGGQVFISVIILQQKETASSGVKSERRNISN